MAEAIATIGNKQQAVANARRLLRVGDFNGAEEQSRVVLKQDDRCVASNFILGLVLRQRGQIQEAQAVQKLAIEMASLQHEVFEAAMALAENRIDASERLLRQHLGRLPEDLLAMRMLAEIAARTGHFDHAEQLLEHVLRDAPEYEEAASLLDAVERARKLQDMRLSTERSRSTLAVDDEELRLSLAPSQTFAEAIKLYELAVEMRPSAPQNWVSYGHVLRTVGRQEDAVSAYRRAIREDPRYGESWWALADLKTAQFNEDDIQTMERLVRESAIGQADLAAIHFALGKAFEQAGAIENSFAHYAAGSRLKSEEARHDREAVTRHVDRSVEFFSKDYFKARTSAGMNSPDPIFVLGMPRAGSTLVEQILASHPKIEATMELPEIGRIASSLADGTDVGFQDSNFFERLSLLGGSDLERLGKAYIWGTGLRRTTARPFFVDKMPNNWLHIGLILTILPNAKIIDARRHPMACGFSNFKQHFAKGQGFTYCLRDIGAYYADYVRMMRHFDTLMPGRIHRVIHEQLIDDPETQIGAMLDYLELEFHPACLKFHETKRAVRTSSSEQVRKPLNREGLDQWRQFEPWLGDLRESLGELVEIYPAVPPNSKGTNHQ